MRLKSLFLADMRFQAKYGFYFLYVVLTVVYVLILVAIPESWREKAAAILIYSDPAAMGLFFMGAIVLLEKNEHTQCAAAVSPVRSGEYILSKAGSLSVISFVVAAVLTMTAGVDHLCIVLTGTVISSVIFTLSGIVIATKIVSLNQFIIWTVPIEILCFVPVVLHLFKITPAWFRYYPVNVCMDMISGRLPSITGLFSVMIMIVMLYILARTCVLKMWDGLGGVKI